MMGRVLDLFLEAAVTLPNVGPQIGLGNHACAKVKSAFQNLTGEAVRRRGGNFKAPALSRLDLIYLQ